ncbi:Crp/Fnr family transcriptional regulator [Novosphingobium subterraneum]|uniref:Crp/Fnr family transcriptional regulator n=1 Tax=Novosphingobium subterraneum TaxID=48936 RepID=UPI003CFE8101
MAQARQSSGPRMFNRYSHLARAGDHCADIHRIREGWACRYDILADGRRQITDLYLPGDYCEPQWLITRKASAPIMALTRLSADPVSIDLLYRQDQEGVRQVLSGIVRNLERQTQWLVRLGRKNATERILELLADLHERLGASDQPTLISLSQIEIADVVGLTPVHVNRILHRLAEKGLVVQQGRSLFVTPLIGTGAEPGPEKCPVRKPDVVHAGS